MKFFMSSFLFGQKEVKYVQQQYFASWSASHLIGINASFYEAVAIVVDDDDDVFLGFE